ncbi:hypothetical protein BpHYR1_042740 [Brachionus plicatilis]|uniref:Uncharacterized protein n=1 Tax=Brachionus plicatilis TaxID=10195 RepID=A0A3M7SAL4_BRAPC|nr:hypothetical protein BpHYR1_042740 [Brachionus plicatilis]
MGLYYVFQFREQFQSEQSLPRIFILFINMKIPRNIANYVPCTSSAYRLKNLFFFKSIDLLSSLNSNAQLCSIKSFQNWAFLLTCIFEFGTTPVKFSKLRICENIRKILIIDHEQINEDLNQYCPDCLNQKFTTSFGQILKFKENQQKTTNFLQNKKAECISDYVFNQI